MPLRRLLILLINLCLLLSLSAQALSAAVHPCVGDAVPASGHERMDQPAMDHSQHAADMATAELGMDCCEGADDCPMDQCVVLPATLTGHSLQIIWLVGGAAFRAPHGSPANAVYPPYHPPFFA